MQTGGILCIRQDGAAADDRSAAGGAVGQAVLRLEAELNRGAMKQHLGRQKSNYQFLKQGVKRAGKVIDWYLKRVYKDNTSPHLRYEDAVACIAGQRWKDKTKERQRICCARSATARV